jgi:hypothetical protein
MSTNGSEPRFVYVVFSHQRPVQVERLVRRILALSPAGQVVLHHDGRTEPMAWSEPPGPRVHVIEPKPMDWGGFTMVAATATALDYLEHHLPYDWCVVLSGQDYPVTDLAAWEDELSGSGAHYLLAAQKVNVDSQVPRRTLVKDEYYVRYAYRWRPLGRFPTVAVAVVNRLAAVVGAGPLLITRPFKGHQKLGRATKTPFDDGWGCFKGSQWMAMSASAVHRILETMDRRPELARYYRTTLVPDESFFQSILCNEADLLARNHRLTYTVWAGSGSAHPKVLRLDDVAGAFDSGCAFARKFDMAVDAEALDFIDRSL